MSNSTSVIGLQYYKTVLVGVNKCYHTVIGLLINFANIDPIRMLVYSAMINGVVAAPITVIKIANDKNILRDKVNGKISNIIGLIAVVAMGIAVVIMFLSWGH